VKLMKCSIGKRGSLSLSINAIVVLIMAITMLGIGLFFIKNSMGGAMNQFNDVNQQIKSDMIAGMKDSTERITFKGEDVQFKAGDKKDLYFAIKNDGGNETTYGVLFKCIDSMAQDAGTCADSDGGNCVKIVLKTFNSVAIKPNEVNVGKLSVNIGATIIPDTYRCVINITDTTAEPDELYSTKSFYLTVN
jgi:hypothetical protein